MAYRFEITAAIVHRRTDKAYDHTVIIDQDSNDSRSAETLALESLGEQHPGCDIRDVRTKSLGQLLIDVKHTPIGRMVDCIEQGFAPVLAGR